MALLSIIISHVIDELDFQISDMYEEALHNTPFNKEQLDVEWGLVEDKHEPPPSEPGLLWTRFVLWGGGEANTSVMYIELHVASVEEPCPVQVHLEFVRDPCSEDHQTTKVPMLMVDCEARWREVLDQNIMPLFERTWELAVQEESDRSNETTDDEEERAE